MSTERMPTKIQPVSPKQRRRFVSSLLLTFLGLSTASPAYAASKAGVVNLTKDTALELAPHGGTVNAICPGYIETAIQDELTEQDIKESIEKTPLPRLGLPKDIGLAALFLASDDAEWITGISLVVDGGMLAPLPVA